MARTEIGNGAEVAEAVRHATARLSQDLSKTARDAQMAAAELATAVRHSAEDIGERTMERARRATEAARESMREHPIAWFAAGISAAALAGYLLARRR